MNRQRARSIHFLALWWFLLYILAHVTLVSMTGPARISLNMMWAGVNDDPWSGFAMFAPLITLVGLLWWRASPFTIRHARLVQKTGEFMVGWIKNFAEWWSPDGRLTEKDISPCFWPDRTMPASAEFDTLVSTVRVCLSAKP